TIGAIANLGVVPLAGAATVLGLVAVVCSFLSDAIAGWFFNAVWPVLVALRALVFVTAAAPGALVHLPAPPPPAIACYVIALLSALSAWRLRDRHARYARAATIASVALVVTALGLAAW